MKASSVVSIAVLAASLGLGCSATAEPEAADATESSIRAMTPDEVIGEMIYGETIDVDYTNAPKYRAFWFNGQRGDQIMAQVVAHDATDPVLWLADASFNTLAVNSDTRVGDLNALLSGRILPKTGKYFVIFREVNNAPRAKFSVTLRLLGRLPLDCDPDGEGIALPECIDPLEYDPFSPTSCQGTPMSAATAKTKFGVTGGFRLAEAKIFYRTRQCAVDAGSTPQCSPWVRAFGMDVRLASIAPPVAAADAPPPPADTYAFLPADTTRKINLDFSIAPLSSTRYCVDGPFTNVRGDAWTALEGETPALCGSSSAVVNTTCARFEPKTTIQIESGNPAYYTEFGAVLYARY